MRLLGVVSALALLGVACGSNRTARAPLPPPIEISFVASTVLPRSTEAESLEIGGISALAYDSRHWLALSDARVSTRFYEMDVALDELGLRVATLRSVALENADALDTEGLVKTPWGDLLVSTEGDADKEPALQPRLLEFDSDGALLRRIEIPEKFLFAGVPPHRGIRDNLGFESLALSPDAKRLFLAAEGTLAQDGPVAAVDSVGFSRILVYDVAGGVLSAAQEFVYPLGPFLPAPDFVEQEVTGGLVELVSLNRERLLALERLFFRELSGEKRDRNQARIFSVSLSSATDVRSIDSLGASGDWRPVTKELVLDLDDVVGKLSPEHPRLDNIEAMAIGPELPGGGRALLLASDDNFQAKQRTQFLLFRLMGSDQ